MGFEVVLDKRVHSEIEKGIEDLVSKNFNAAKKFYLQIQETYSTLAKNPYYQIRYKMIRCIPIKGFPYMFHFSLNEKSNCVQIHPLIHTSMNPEKSWLK